MARSSVKQLADLHGISKAMIYVWVEERRFPVYRIGAQGRRGRILIDDETFSAFLTTQRIEAGPVQSTGPLSHIRPKA
jgi:hypothetical protein